jgi:hypothetical protein
MTNEIRGCAHHLLISLVIFVKQRGVLGEVLPGEGGILAFYIDK